MKGPCCWGISLKRGVTLVAIFEFCLSLFGASMLTIGLIRELGEDYKDKVSIKLNNESTIMITPKIQPKKPIYVKIGNDVHHDLTFDQLKEMYDEHIATLIGFLIMLIVQIILAWVLYRGATHEKLKKLNVWWWIKFGLLVAFIIFDIIGMFVGENRITEIAILAEVIYQVYVLWLVKCLMDQMRFGTRITSNFGDDDQIFSDDV